MSKSVMISIQPKWCELIANGKKIIEVRKTKPKLETPFKVYIYCTKKIFDIRYSDSAKDWKKNGCGKVIGEFVCENVDRIVHCGTCNNDIRLNIVDKNFYCKALDYEYLNKCKLSYSEIEEYSNGGDVYGWHISDLVIYDKPRELREFWKWCYSGCDNCDNQCWKHSAGDKALICIVENKKPITRPPQSWCYVESGVTK